MNGDTICWVLVERHAADNPRPDEGVHVPRHVAFSSEADAMAAAERGSRDEQGRPKVIVAEIVDRRTT